MPLSLSQPQSAHTLGPKQGASQADTQGLQLVWLTVYQAAGKEVVVDQRKIAVLLVEVL